MCFFLLRQTQTAHFILHYLTFFTSQCTPFYPKYLNPLNAELNSIRHLLALVGARHIVHVSRIRVNQNDCKQDLGKCTAVIFFLFFCPVINVIFLTTLLLSSSSSLSSSSRSSPPRSFSEHFRGLWIR
jgi:hypothetical protein